MSNTQNNNQKEFIREYNSPPAPHTLADASEIWLQSQKIYWKPGTYAVYSQSLTKYILPYLGQMSLCQITDGQMELFASYLALNPSGKKLSSNYIAQICSIVPRIISYMNQRHRCNVPMPHSPIPKKYSRQLILPDGTCMASLEKYLIQHCAQDTCLGILIAFHTGIRLGELSALTWKDINIVEETIYIRKNILRVKTHISSDFPESSLTQIVNQSPKTPESIRIIPIPSRLLPLLRKYKKEDTAYIISGTKCPWAEPRTIQYRFRAILQNCGVEYFNFHMLRHAFATRCVSMGLDIKNLSEILGHSNIQTTLNLYVHSTIRQKKQLMKQYDSLLQNNSQSYLMFS